MGGPLINPDGKAVKPPSRLPDSTPLLPCPFCGSHDIDPEGWASTDDHGPACMNCSGSAQTIELWNSRPHLKPTNKLGCSFCHEQGGQPDGTRHKNWCPKISNVLHGQVIF